MKQEQADRMEAMLEKILESQSGVKERVTKLETQAGYFHTALAAVISVILGAGAWLAKKGLGG